MSITSDVSLHAKISRKSITGRLCHSLRSDLLPRPIHQAEKEIEWIGVSKFVVFVQKDIDTMVST